MSKISEHFDSRELMCPCGCGGCYYTTELILKLEALSNYIGNKPIIVTSGFRCPMHSVSVGGYPNDAHTLGLAVDVYVDGLTPEDIAEAGEIVGFSGIGLMNGACHLDVRTVENYANGHWFGDERTGNDNIPTFVRNPPKKYPYTKQSTIQMNGKYYEITIKEVQ